MTENTSLLLLPDFFREVDIHTHASEPRHPAIINIVPGRQPGEHPYYSIGIHPWVAAEADARTFALLEDTARDTRVVAIGEAGIDRRHGPSLEVQIEVFERQARLAQTLGKPLIIHCVAAYADILAIYKRLRPTVPWIIHGFRGKPVLARQLTDAGLYLSLGSRFNPEVPAAVDPRFLLRETDTPAE